MYIILPEYFSISGGATPASNVCPKSTFLPPTEITLLLKVVSGLKLRVPKVGWVPPVILPEPAAEVNANFLYEATGNVENPTGW